MYAVMDKDWNPWGPFESPAHAVDWAEKKWPKQPPNDPRDPPHREGWSIVAIRPAE